MGVSQLKPEYLSNPPFVCTTCKNPECTYSVIQNNILFNERFVTHLFLAFELRFGKLLKKQQPPDKINLY